MAGHRGSEAAYQTKRGGERPCVVSMVVPSPPTRGRGDPLGMACKKNCCPNFNTQLGLSSLASDAKLLLGGTSFSLVWVVSCHKGLKWSR